MALTLQSSYLFQSLEDFVNNVKARVIYNTTLRFFKNNNSATFDILDGKALSTLGPGLYFPACCDFFDR